MNGINVSVIGEVVTEYTRQSRERMEEQQDPPQIGLFTSLKKEIEEAHKALLGGRPLKYREKLVEVAAIAMLAIAYFDKIPLDI